MRTDESAVEPLALDPWLEHLTSHAAVARRGEDPEGVHQVRVAAGRLDVWLRIAALRILRDDLRWLRRAAARVRDLDVALASRPPLALAEWMESERASAQAELCAALDAPRFGALTRALALLPPVASERARAYVREARRRAIARGTRSAREDASFEELHRLRRAVRRLRFAREWLGQKPRRLKALQDELGALNDAAVALELVDRSPCAALLAEHRAGLRDELQRRCERAQRAWETLRLDRGEER